MSTKFSIVMNCYNGAEFLKQALDSLIGQNYKDWELIFFDNMSVDSSKEIFKSYKDSRFRYFSAGKFLSLGEGRKEAIRKCNGEWVAFLDTDDIWMPNKLSVQAEVISKVDCVLCYSSIIEINSIGKKIRTLNNKFSNIGSLNEQLYHFEANLVTSIVKLSILKTFNLNFDVLMEASEEVDLFLQVLQFGDFYAIDTPLAKYRVHGNSLTYQKIHRWYIERNITLKKLEAYNPNISSMDGFIASRERANYYCAVNLMSNNEFVKAREQLRNNKSPIYIFLRFLSYFPLLWDIAHKPELKKKLSFFI